MVDGGPGKPAYEGTNRYQPLPACAVSSAELIRLYQALQTKNDELFEDIAKTFEETPERTIEESKKNLRENLCVAVIALGRRGEQVVTYDAGGLREEALPENLMSIGLDSALKIRLLLGGQDPVNRCDIQFDFDKPPLFDLTNPSGEPTRNASHFRIVGANRTWAAAVFDEVTAWIQGKRVRRGWLHKPNTYDALLFFLGIPLAIWGAWRAHVAWIRNGELERNGVGMLVVIWIFVGLLYVFRILFGTARWLWPYVEFKREGKGAATGFRAGLVAVALGILGTFLYDLFRVLVF